MNKDTNKEDNQSKFFLLEQEVLEFWQKNKIFEQSLEKPAPQGDYIFYDGPPFATGTPHYGHIIGQILKDLVPRFFTMKGYRVERKWGWDCHGLPIENIVEREMGTNTKKEIEKIGVEKFNASCRAKVLEYAQEWYTISDQLGRFVDQKNAYHTMDLNYMESVWWVFKSLFEKDLIYRDYRSMHVCPRCETTLAQSEVSEGYEDIKDLSCVAKFKLVDEEKTFILAWTTTPWTLIGNSALAVGEDIDYVKISFSKDGVEEFYILAKNKLTDFFSEGSYKILEEFKGEQFLEKSYEPLFDYYAKDKDLENRDNSWKVYAADFVNTDEGTGVVHIAPAFGQDDMDLGKKNNLAFIQHVNIDGSFKEEVIDFPGLNVKPSGDHMTTDIEIIKYLAGKNLLFSKEKYEHSYPHCWRCHTPLINYASSSWFVNVLKIKDNLLEEAKKINWSPSYIKEGRFGKWLEGARDWSISRQRFWATPLPVWECSCGEIKVIGSVEELETLSGKKVDDLHKDVVDKLEIDCPQCSAKMTRDPDVLDCWLESGSMPYAQLHYPFENKEKFENNFPAEFIAEGIDQTRTWFYYLHVVSVALFNSNSFKNVIVNGMVLAEDGKKMSKSLKNYPDPVLIMYKYGADALRAYLFSSPVIQAENFNFSEKGVEDALRKNIMLLNNIYNFYQIYSEHLSESDFSKYQESDNVLDLWILEKMNILIKEVDDFLLKYNPVKAMREISYFIDEFSTWYLRRSRDRFKGEDLLDRTWALSTMRLVVLKVSQVIAPFMPFIAEQLWQKITKFNFQNSSASVHLESWPELENLNKESTLEKMELVRQIVELGLAKRDEAKIKVRQILSQTKVFCLEDELSEEYLNLIKEELNVKEIVWKKINEGFLSVDIDTEISPELKREGLKRDLVRAVNNLRKKFNLSVNDIVKVYLRSEDEETKELVEVFKDDLKKDTVAEDFILASEPLGLEISQEEKINLQILYIEIEKV